MHLALSRILTPSFLRDRLDLAGNVRVLPADQAIIHLDAPCGLNALVQLDAIVVAYSPFPPPRV